MSNVLGPSPVRGHRIRIGLLVAVLGLAFAGGCVADAGPGPEPFPNLDDAENNLQAAITSLRQAPPVFGGHKAEAIRLIESAIDQIEMAKASAEQ